MAAIPQQMAMRFMPAVRYSMIPIFRVLKKFWIGQKIRSSFPAKAPEVPLSEQGQFDVRSVNTFFADIQYQGMVIWVQRYLDGAKSLPLQTAKASIFEPIPFGKQLFVNVKIQERTAFKMVATCTVYDAEGKVYMLTEGATITVSKQLTW